MRVSTKGRYAIRLMIDLARHTGQCVPIKDIAERQNISAKYLEQIVSALVKAKYVKSSRGPLGGYELSRPPAEITAGMILRVTEGSLAPVPCLDHGNQTCPEPSACDAHLLWTRLKSAIDSVVDHVTLDDLTLHASESTFGMWL